MSKRKVIVIGSGFGGLSVAIRLQSAGHQVTVLEMRDRPGGRAYVYEDQGFTFDAGPTVITAPECLEELFALSGRHMNDYVRMKPVSPFYRLLWEDGTTFDYDSDLVHTVEQIKEMSPEDIKGYEKFLNYSQEVFEAGYVDLAHEAFLDIWSMVRVSPQLMKLKAYRTVYDMVSHFIKDEHLRQAFSFHSLLVGGNPFETSSIYTLIHYLERKWGVHFPEGGTGALVQGLVRLFKDLGGTLHLSAEVDEIVTSQNQVKGVRLVDGTWFECDEVVSNADVVHTYKHLLKNNSNAAPTRTRLDKMRYSMSLFLIYFGTHRTYPELAHHNIVFGPRYKGLLDDIFKKGVLADDFSLYLHAPTRTDASLAPAGCESFYVLSPVPHMGHLDVDWQEQGPRYADRILSYLEKHYLPGLKNSLVTQRIFTPLDFKTELNAHFGSAFSLEPTLLQSAYFRTHNRDRHIRGLYFVGAGTHPGAGIPGVVNSAKATAKLILEEKNWALNVSALEPHVQPKPEVRESHV